MSIFARLRDVIFPPITSAGFRDFRALKPKRICFGSTHKDALKNKDGSYVGTLKLPFSETIGTVLPWEIYKSKFGGYFRGIKTADEFAEIQSWIEERRDLVFIRSLMTTAIAAGEHFAEDGTRSRVGALERAAKYDGSLSARQEVEGLLLSAFQRVHGGRKIDAIAAVPASTPGAASLPAALAASLSKSTGIEDVSNKIRWSGPKAKIKETAVDAKWTALEATGLTVEIDLQAKNVLLIDDMYQSGATVHFVASCLRQSGADDIHCLAVSKGRRDTDNT
jgi:phosphoribosylpyrophosphate synthetase